MKENPEKKNFINVDKFKKYIRFLKLQTYS